MIGKTNSVGTVLETGIPDQPIPTFTYTGTYDFIDEGEDNWRLKFLTSGTFTITSTYPNPYYVDAFLVGGGGGGSYDDYAGGGGGGYTRTVHTVSLKPNQGYDIVIGAGGAGASGTTHGNNGLASTAFGYSAKGGEGGRHWDNTGIGGNGGSGGAGEHTAAGGTDGSDGGGSSRIGRGQGFTTREFEELSGILYSAGGAAGNRNTASTSGTNNTGNGGMGGAAHTPGSGGSGIVIIRNTRVPLPHIEGLSFTYTGNYQLIDDANNNWRIKFLSNGTFRLLSLPSNQNTIDIFLVGGGGGGSSDSYGGGGGGGYTNTQRNFSVTIGTDYPIVIGAGGAGGAYTTSGSAGGASIAFGFTANGGAGSTHTGNVGGGGNGGSGGAGSHTGVNGFNGTDGTSTGGGVSGGTGQRVTTREFSETGATLYSTGGACGHSNNRGRPGLSNTGDGSGGSSNADAPSGGSGIVIIRNHRQPITPLILYNYGGENDITGGWYLTRNSTNGDVFAQKLTDSLKIGYVLRPSGSHEWAYAETVNKIDLSQYSTLTIHTKETGNVLGTGNIQLGVSTVRGDMNGYNLVELNCQTGEHDTVYDISSITASLYIRIRAYRTSGGSNNCQCYIYSVTLS